MAVALPSLLILQLVLPIFPSPNTAPPLKLRVTAPSPNELILSWDAPAGVDKITHYKLMSRDVITDVRNITHVAANVTRYRLTELTSNGSYFIQVSWHGVTVDSIPAAITVRPIEVYRDTIEKRGRPPAMLIFYGIIGSACLVYIAVVATLVTYFCRRKRQRRRSFSATLDRPAQPWIYDGSTANPGSLSRYSRAEDMLSASTNRVSTFTGAGARITMANSKSEAIAEDCGGYEAPLSNSYITPRPGSVSDDPPDLPERTYKKQTDTNTEENFYEEPEEVKELKLPQRKTKKPKLSKFTNAKRINASIHNSLETLPVSPPSTPRSHVRRNQSLNAASDKTVKPVRPIPPIPRDATNKNMASKPLPNPPSEAIPYAVSNTLPMLNTVSSSLPNAISSSLPNDASGATPIKSSATVRRNDSLRAVTIHTELEEEGPGSSPNVLGRDLLEAAAEDGFQITVTLRSKPKQNKPAIMENSYDLVD